MRLPLRDIHTYLLALALVYAPWAYGCTREWTVMGLDSLLLAAFGFWLLAKLLKKETPHIPWIPLICSGVILSAGWWMAWNAHNIFDDAFWQAIPINSPFPNLPGALDQFESRKLMLHYSALLAGFCIVLDRGRDSHFRKQLLLIIALTAISMAILGIAQRATQAIDIFWVMEHGPKSGRSFFFATYRYHGNAGSFFNLTWPLIGIFFLQIFRPKASPWAKTFCPIAFLLVTGCLFVHGSRAASAIAFLLIPVWCFWHRRTLWHSWKQAHKIIKLIAIALCLALVAGALYSSNFTRTQDRWEQLAENQGSVNYRLQAYKGALPIIPQAGALGFGPGCFRWVFSDNTDYKMTAIASTWFALHQDYMQTVIEWGWVGTLFWSVLFFGGWLRALQLARLPRESLSSFDRHTSRAIVLALGTVMIHSLMDFPLQVASLQFYALTLCAIGWAIPWPGKGKSGKSSSQAAA